MAGLIDPIELISVAIKVGRAIHERYKTYKHATVDLQRLDGHLGGSLFVLETFQEFIKRNIGSLRPHQKQEIIALVDQLQGVFDRLDKQMSRLPADAKFDLIKKLRWSFGGKSGYEAIILEMKEWRSELNEVITAIKLIQEGNSDSPDGHEDSDCRKRLFRLVGTGLRQAAIMEDILCGRQEAKELHSVASDRGSIISFDSTSTETLYSDAYDSKIARLAADNQLILFEYRPCKPRALDTNRQETVPDVLKLGSILGHADSDSMHILRCIGAEYREEENRCLLLYSIPGHYTSGTHVPMTLLQAINDEKVPKPSLEVRVRYAKEITLAVMFTHAAGLVHKAVCPESILVIPTSEDSSESSAFLFGYDAAGLADIQTYRKKTSRIDPMKRLYSHPDRQVHQDANTITCGMRHDMYSLGIVLLEIGMWKSFRHMNQTLQEIFNMRSRDDFDTIALRESLLKEAKNNLPCETGSIYASAVVCCLNRTMPQNINEREMKEVFYERVMQKLHRIIV